MSANPIQLTDLILETKLYSRWLICQNDDIQLKPLEAEVSGKCYRWYKKNTNGIFIDYNKKTYEISEHPNITSWYRVDLMDCNSTGPIKSWYIKVYVATSISIMESDGKTECMDEFSQIKIIGQVNCVDYNEVSTMEMDVISIEAQFIPDQSIPLPSEKVAITYGKFKMKTPFKVPQITPGKGKSYILKNRAIFGDCISNTVDINVYRLWIEEFNNMNSNDKPMWNVVVNNSQPNDSKVHCLAQATSIITEFEWLPWSDLWEFTNNKSSSKILDNLNFLPANGKMPDLNDYFGTNTGEILLVAKDPIGNLYRVSSSDISSKKISSKNGDKYENWRYMDNNKKARVFFHKDDRIVEFEGNTPRNPLTIPQWLYYWRQCIKTPYPKYVKFIKFEEGNDEPPAYFGLPRRDISQVVTTLENRIVVKQITSEKAKIRNKMWTSIAYAYGIEAFYIFLSHELEHARLMNEEIWPNGFNQTEDLDITTLNIGDYYNDIWETKNRSPDYKFSKKYDDYYKHELLFKQFKNPDQKILSVGYKYEETIGFTAEYNAKDKMEGDTKYLDWSFDRKGFYNSKQWK
ncbi:MAG: hypothetical protein IPK88_04215 [Saprospiraceae bacterium]|nr:hypothetical protein [Candidatus Defluviibacterium haderslevense]